MGLDDCTIDEAPVLNSAADDGVAEQGVRIRTHPGLCVGWGNCHRFAPDVYPLDENGKVDVHLLEVPAELDDAAARGASERDRHQALPPLVRALPAPARLTARHETSTDDRGLRGWFRRPHRRGRATVATPTEHGERFHRQPSSGSRRYIAGAAGAAAMVASGGMLLKVLLVEAWRHCHGERTAAAPGARRRRHSVACRATPPHCRDRVVVAAAIAAPLFAELWYDMRS
jgi:ferredoxin